MSSRNKILDLIKDQILCMHTCSHAHRACWLYQIHLKCSISLKKKSSAIKSIKNDLNLTLRTPWCKGRTSSCLWSSDCHTHKFYVAKYFASPKKVSCCGLDSNFQWLWSVISFNYNDAIVTTTITTKPSGLFLWEYEEVKLENSIFKYFYTYSEANFKKLYRAQ